MLCVIELQLFLERISFLPCIVICFLLERSNFVGTVVGLVLTDFSAPLIKLSPPR